MSSPSPPRVVVLLEGRSDVAAVRTLLTARGVDERGVDERGVDERGVDEPSLRLVDMGGVTNVRRHLDDLLVGPEQPRVLGMCDAGETAVFQAALTSHGFAVADVRALADLGFQVCDRDLEDELIRALGTDRVLEVLDGLRLGARFATLQQQPAWRGQPLQAQLRRFAGVASGRKALLGEALAAALTPQQVPVPLAGLLDQIERALAHEPDERSLRR